MRKSKAQTIRSLLTQGKTAKEIAALIGVTPQYVYGIRHDEKKKRTMKVRKYVRKEQPASNPPLPAPKLTLRQRFMALFTGRV